ncbi:MAG: hypothetical protein NVV74_06605 [Magnetospirillum sp.]|nr:hypothetical protein [Magnetospirillum sp.]
MSAPAPAAIRERLLVRLRALMARTVANGCTEEEELAAARLVGKVVAQVDGTAPPEPAEAPPPWAQAERKSSEYQAVLEKNTAEALLKAAVQELALNHINTVSPPRRRVAGERCERVDIHELLEPHLGMMLPTAATRMGRQILRHIIDELVYEGALPRFLDLPIGR